MTFWEKLSKIEDYVHKYWYYFASPFVMGFIVIYFSNAQDDKKELEENLKTTIGKVYRYSYVPKKSKKVYYYEFQLNGKKYKGNTTGYRSDGVSIGKYYRVEYSKINPDNNRMNFDFEFIVNYERDSIGNIIDTNYIGL